MGFEPTTTEFRSDALTDSAIRHWVQLTLTANFVQLLQFHRLFSVTFHFGYCLHHSPRLFELKVSWGNHMSVAEWADIYDIHHWRIIWSSYRKLAWFGFEPTAFEFRSDALTDWGIRPWVQLALRANFVQPLQFHSLFSVIFHFISIYSYTLQSRSDKRMVRVIKSFFILTVKYETKNFVNIVQQYSTFLTLSCHSCHSCLSCRFFNIRSSKLSK